MDEMTDTGTLDESCRIGLSRKEGTLRNFSFRIVKPFSSVASEGLKYTLLDSI